jgi:Raf kinase inhibitor-like YbhB/YbcL family protein
MRRHHAAVRAIAAAFLALAACQTAGFAQGGTTVASEMKITSAAFADGAEIPAQHTCQGGDASPPLSFEGVPATAKSLALIVDDPDAPDPKAPKTTWVHWVAYNIPPTTNGLAAGTTALPAGAASGLNDWKRAGWGGPCPPIGRHRYFFKLYALDTVLRELGAPTKAQLLDAMKGHVVAEAALVGTYQKKLP